MVADRCCVPLAVPELYAGGIDVCRWNGSEPHCVPQVIVQLFVLCRQNTRNPLLTNFFTHIYLLGTISDEGNVNI